MLRLSLGVAIFIFTLAVIMLRPYRIPESLAAAGGAIVMLLGGFVRPVEALVVVRDEWNVYFFFLGLMTISAFADQSGVLEALARVAGRWAGGSALRLYLATFAAGALITAFLSNDATALILTPIVYALVVRLRLPVLPFMFACTFIADTASFVLPVSNPINVLVLTRFGSGLSAFLHYLFLPSLACIALNAGLFAWLFRHDLRTTYNPSDVPPVSPPNRGFFSFVFVVLIVIAVAYVFASAFRLPVSMVAMGAAIVLVIGAAHFRCLDLTRLGREMSWSIFVFVAGMLVIVRAVENMGLTAMFGRLLLQVAGHGPFAAILATASGAAVGANLINNVPMALVMMSALGSVPAANLSHQPLIYATILGADLGPNLTTVGSLATILWMLILRRKGLEISTVEYFKLGLVVVPPMIVIGSVLIWLNL